MTHPTDGQLASYAAGSIPGGMGLLVASHLTYCPICRDKAARLETLGGAFLSETPPGHVAPPDFARTLARLDAGRPILHCSAPGADPVLPGPLLGALGRRSDEIRWRRLLPGLSDCCLDGFGEEDVRLVRVRPGARLLAHTHEGCEATLVLAGALRDNGVTYRAGAVSICGPEHDHRPDIVGEEDCICLIVLAGRMRFTGSVGRVLNVFAH